MFGRCVDDVCFKVWTAAEHDEDGADRQGYANDSRPRTDAAPGQPNVSHSIDLNAVLTLVLQQGAEHGAQERFQSFMTMMDSMTDKELDHPDIQKLLSDTQQVRKTCGHDGSKFPPWAAKGAPSIGRSRIKRIAIGCGQAEPMVLCQWCRCCSIAALFLAQRRHAFILIAAGCCACRGEQKVSKDGW